MTAPTEPTATPEPVYVKFFASAGDIANAPIHESDPMCFDEMPDADTLDDESVQFMWESVCPDRWWVFTDADGNEVSR